MKITLTGAAGFIGSHTCKALLNQGHEVIGIDNFDPFYDKSVKERNLQPLQSDANFTFIQADIRNAEAFESVPKSDVLIHLAAKAGVLPSTKDPGGYVETNIVGTMNLLEWMRRHDMKKLLFASSSSVYGNNKKIPFEEDDFVGEPISPYAFTKRSCELMNHSYHHLYQMDILNLRFFTVYGPGQRPDLAIHKFIRLINNDQPISMYGDGSTSRDYTFVNDTVSGILAALDYITSHEQVYEILNLGNNQPVKLKDLINAIGKVIGKKPQINVMPKQPGDVDITYASIDKAKNLLGYQPKTTLEEGLQHFLDWYEQQK